MFNPYGKHAEGLPRMEVVIREYEQTHPDGWPSHANVPFSGYVQMLERVNRHADAETFVKKHLEKIYGNLGVHNRTQAVARARELSLL